MKVITTLPLCKVNIAAEDYGGIFRLCTNKSARIANRPRAFQVAKVPQFDQENRRTEPTKRKKRQFRLVDSACVCSSSEFRLFIFFSLILVAAVVYLFYPTRSAHISGSRNKIIDNFRRSVVVCGVIYKEERTLIAHGTMKCIIIWAASSILLGAALGQKEPPPGGFYTTRYDHLDVENILNQKRLVYYYSACILGKGPCTPQGIEFRRELNQISSPAINAHYTISAFSRISDSFGRPNFFRKSKTNF